jgi:oxalate decarboxylase
VRTGDDRSFERIDLGGRMRSSPRQLLSNNFAGLPQQTLTKLEQTS